MRIRQVLSVPMALALMAPAAARAEGPETLRDAFEGKVVKGMPYRAEAVTE